MPEKVCLEQLERFQLLVYAYDEDGGSSAVSWRLPPPWLLTRMYKEAAEAARNVLGLTAATGYRMFVYCSKRKLPILARVGSRSTGRCRGSAQ